MHVIDSYLTAHNRYVKALEELHRIGALLRDVGESLLASPQCVRFEETAVILEGRKSGPDARNDWPVPAELNQMLTDFAAARDALVAEGNTLMDARAPESIRKAVAERSNG